MDDDDDGGFGGCGGSAYVFHSAPLPADVHITPSYLGNRLFSVSSTEHFVASGGKVHHLKLTLDSLPEETSAPTIPFQSISATQIPSLQHNSLISSLSLNTKRGICLGSIDESGNTRISALSGDNIWRSDTVSDRAVDGEIGWCGLDFDPVDENRIYTALGFQRSLSLFDVTSKSLVRSVHCTHNPTSVTVTEDGLVAMAEHNQVSIWDLRASERKGCVRLLPIILMRMRASPHPSPSAPPAPRRRAVVRSDRWPGRGAAGNGCV